MILGTYLKLLVSCGTTGVLLGQGRPLTVAVLSMAFELPLSIGGVAAYVLLLNGTLLGVYWWGAIAAGIECFIVVAVLAASDWPKYVEFISKRQEAKVAAGDGDGDAVSESTSEKDHVDATSDSTFEDIGIVNDCPPVPGQASWMC
jgi:hypothetical protein